MTWTIACGVRLACLSLLLAGCAAMPNLLPTNRVLLTCPAELQYSPRRYFPPIPLGPLTNQFLDDYAGLLIVQLRQEWKRFDQAQSDCAEWMKGQGWKP